MKVFRVFGWQMMLKVRNGLCCAKSLSCVRLFATPWPAAHPAPPSMGILQARVLEYSGLPCPPPGDLPNPGIQPRSPALRADSLLSEPPGKPRNTGVGSPALLQGIFPTQELNWGLLHCRQILYQLSYQGSPDVKLITAKNELNGFVSSI